MKISQFKAGVVAKKWGLPLPGEGKSITRLIAYELRVESICNAGNGNYIFHSCDIEHKEMQDRIRPPAGWGI